LIKQDITQGNSQPILEHASFPDTQVVIDLPQPFDPPAAPVPILFNHFAQANGTPLTEEPLKTWLGTHGETSIKQDIAQGNSNEPILQ
jgi:hypothetical protein